MAAARRAAATRPSPDALRPGGLVPRAVRRLPRGRIAAVLAVPAVGRATTTARVPRVAATGLPGAERPEGPGRPRVAPAGRAVVPGMAVVARTALGTLAGLRGAARAGPARISPDAGDSGWSRDRDDDRRPGSAGRDSGAPSRGAGGRYDRQGPAPGDRPRRSGPPAGGAGGRFSGSDRPRYGDSRQGTDRGEGSQGGGPRGGSAGRPGSSRWSQDTPGDGPRGGSRPGGPRRAADPRGSDGPRGGASFRGGPRGGSGPRGASGPYRDRDDAARGPRRYDAPDAGRGRPGDRDNAARPSRDRDDVTGGRRNDAPGRGPARGWAGDRDGASGPDRDRGRPFRWRRAGMTGRTVMAVAVLVGRAGMTGRTAMAVAVLVGRAGMTGRTAARVTAGRAGQAAIAMM